jgi:hypothetical protein
MKKDNTNPWLMAIALFGGGYVFVELLKMFSKEVIWYNCTLCQYDKLEYGTKVCPNCKSNLEWPKQS